MNNSIMQHDCVNTKKAFELTCYEHKNNCSINHLCFLSREFVGRIILSTGRVVLIQYGLLYPVVASPPGGPQFPQDRE